MKILEEREVLIPPVAGQHDTNIVKINTVTTIACHLDDRRDLCWLL